MVQIAMQRTLEAQQEYIKALETNNYNRNRFDKNCENNLTDQLQLTLDKVAELNNDSFV